MRSRKRPIALFAATGLVSVLSIVLAQTFLDGWADVLMDAGLLRGIKQWGTQTCRQNRDCDELSTCADGICVPSLCGDGLRGNNEQCEYPSVRYTSHATCPDQSLCTYCRCVSTETVSSSRASEQSGEHPAGSSSGTVISSVSAHQWEEAPSLPRETGNAAVLTFHDALWVVGGSAGDGDAASAVYAMHDGRNWELQSSMPVRISLLAAVVYENKIWVIGGRDQWGKASALVYTSSDGITWEQETSLPRKLYGHRAVVFGGKILVLGGQDEQGKVSRSIYSYDTITERWQAEMDLPRAFALGMAEIFHDRLWILGGIPASPDLYTTADGVEWQKEGTLPAPSQDAASTIHDGRLWVLGGEGGERSLRQSYSTLDGRLWSDEGLLPQKLKNHSAVSWNGRLWIVGGGMEPDRRVYVTPPLSAETQGNVGFDELRNAQERVATWGDRAVLSSTPDGRILIYGATENGVVTTLYSLDTLRMRRDILPAPSLEYGAYGQPTVSADGRFIAVREYQWFCRSDCQGMLWLIDAEKGTKTFIAAVAPVGNTGAEDAISRNGLKVVFRARPDEVQGDRVRRSVRFPKSELFIWYRTGDIVQIPLEDGTALEPRFADTEGRFVTYALPDGGADLYDIETGREKAVPVPIGVTTSMVQSLVQQMVEEMTRTTPHYGPQPNPAASSSSRSAQPGSNLTTLPPSFFNLGATSSSARSE